LLAVENTVMGQTPETAERARKIGHNAVTERMPFNCPHCGVKLFGHENRCPSCNRAVTAPDPVRIVYDGWPLKRLSVRGVVSRAQFDAGSRYAEHFRESGLDPFTSINMDRVGGSSEPNVGMPSSLRQAEHRKLYRIGYNALLLPNSNNVLARYVEAIVLFDQEPQEVGKRLTKRTQRDQAGAVAIEFLKVGLNLARQIGDCCHRNTSRTAFMR
jgi:hypothetical protein